MLLTGICSFGIQFSFDSSRTCTLRTYVLARDIKDESNFSMGFDPHLSEGTLQPIPLKKGLNQTFAPQPGSMTYLELDISLYKPKQLYYSSDSEFSEFYPLVLVLSLLP